MCLNILLAGYLLAKLATFLNCQSPFPPVLLAVQFSWPVAMPSFSLAEFFFSQCRCLAACNVIYIDSLQNSRRRDCSDDVDEVSTGADGFSRTAVERIVMNGSLKSTTCLRSAVMATAPAAMSRSYTQTQSSTGLLR